MTRLSCWLLAMLLLTAPLYAQETSTVPATPAPATPAAAPAPTPAATPASAASAATPAPAPVAKPKAVQPVAHAPAKPQPRPVPQHQDWPTPKPAPKPTPKPVPVTKPVPAPKPAPITAPVTPKPAAAAAPVAAPVAAAPTAPTSLPKTLEIKDAQGRVIGTMPNPEATTPLTVPAPAKAAPAEKKPDLLSQIINTVLSLALVLVLAYLALLGLKRLGAGSTRPPAAAGSARLFRVLESQTLAPGCSVHVVLVGTQVLLVGQTGQQVTVLRDLTGDPVVQAAMQQGAGGGGFLAALSRFLTPAGAPPAGQGIPLADYVRGQRPSPPPEEDGR